MAKVLLDTDVVINLLRKREETLNKLSSLGQCEFYISPIVVAEVYAGAKSKEGAQIEALFSYFNVVDINVQIGRISGNYANQFRKAFHNISLEDYIIAATANYYNLALWSYNLKHYPMRDIAFV
jgi:predicted nucleic acid-binding protein